MFINCRKIKKKLTSIYLTFHDTKSFAFSMYVHIFILIKICFLIITNDFCQFVYICPLKFPLYRSTKTSWYKTCTKKVNICFILFQCHIKIKQFMCSIFHPANIFCLINCGDWYLKNTSISSKNLILYDNTLSKFYNYKSFKIKSKCILKISKTIIV